MPRVQDLQASFNSGELHPRLAARLDFAKYRSGLEECENLIVLSEGGAMRRSGTRYVAEVKSSSVKGRLKRFIFSVTQAYMLELGDRIMRFYRNQAQIAVANTDAVITNGTFTSNITDWDDRSTGGAGNQISWDRPTQSLLHFDGANGSTTITDEIAINSWTASGNAVLSTAQFKFGTASLALDGTGDFVTASAYSLRAGDGFNRSIWFRVTVLGVINTFLCAAEDFKLILRVNAANVLTIHLGDGATYTIATAVAGTTVIAANTWYRARVAWNGATYKVYLSNNGALETEEISVTSAVAFAASTGTRLGADFSGGNAFNGFLDEYQDNLGTQTLGVLTPPTSASSIDTSFARLNLETNGTASDDIGWAEQDVTTTNTNVEHVIKFRVIGAPSDKIEFQVGTASLGAQTLAVVEKEVGYHCVAFTPTTSPFYIQFRNRGSFRDKDVKIDDVSLIDNSGVEIDTPWSEADLYQVEGPQSADTLYLFRDGYHTHKLLRLGHTTWSLVEVPWEDGPYLDENTTTTTLLPSAATGLGITLTLSSIVGVNGGRGWLSTDVGRPVRYKKTTTWGYAIITAIRGTTVAVADVRKDFEAAPTAVTTWRLGSWSGTTGYPQVGGFFQQRLYAAATDDQPETFWASQTADFENFKPDNDAGTVEADDAFDRTLSADDVNAIRWLSPGEDRLAIGTNGGEWVPKSDGVALTPLDCEVRRQTTHGSAQIQPVRVGSVVLFIQRAKRRIREFGFSDAIQGFLAPDMTRLAWHITKGGIVEMAFAQEPESLVCAIRNDGQLLSMTYKREEDIVGWGRAILGGSFGSGNAVVESVAVIPGNNGSGQVQDSTGRDEIWLIVKRTINGATKRYIEVQEKDFETGDPQEDAYYADSIITYDGALATVITGLSHLEGQAVKIWGDGAIQASKTVSGGQITLDTAASVVQIGLGYTHRLKPLKISAGNPAGTPLGKTKRIYGLTFALLDSHTLKFGPDDDNLTEKDFRVVSDPMDAAAPLFTGEQFVEFPGNWTGDARIIIESSDPAPFTLLALAPETQINPLK